MKIGDGRYERFVLCREMLEAAEVVRGFRPDTVAVFEELMKDREVLLLTGEGSSRIFPAKRAICEFYRSSGGQGQGQRQRQRQGGNPGFADEGGTPRTVLITEGATQAMEYGLAGCGVLGASNSGRTRELVRLFEFLRESGHKHLGGVAAHPDTPLEAAADVMVVLGCGAEEAVAATKSVVEQALVWQAFMARRLGQDFPDTKEGGEAFRQALMAAVPPGCVEAMAEAGTVFFAGRNDGVAEELTLKTNEIVRKPAVFLEGTYLLHGIEEVMRQGDLVVLVDPFPQEEARIGEYLAAGLGLTVMAIADRDTSFPTIRVRGTEPWKEYVLLAAGWNLLVEAGLAIGVNLDKPERARKVGNAI